MLAVQMGNEARILRRINEAKLECVPRLVAAHITEGFQVLIMEVLEGAITLQQMYEVQPAVLHRDVVLIKKLAIEALQSFSSMVGFCLTDSEVLVVSPFTIVA